MFDNGFSRAEQEYESQRDAGDCYPKVVRTYKNEDGAWDGDMNCEDCDCMECEHWKKYN